jgi:hypothetical protein
MFYVAGDAAQSWGANLQGSPLIAVNASARQRAAIPEQPSLFGLAP